MTRPDGTPVNAVFGFSNMLAKLLREHVGTHIAVIFDAGRMTFRNRLYEDYKAHRPPAPDDLIPQFNLVREATAAFGVPAIELDDWEADDLIAAYAKATNDAGGQATIVSSDKDLMQLIRPGVEMLDPIKQKPIGPAEVMEKFGVTPDKMIDVQALIGDSTDNVPGVPGIGPKGAAQLINEFGDLDSVLAAAPAMKPSKRRDNLIEHADKARLSRELVTLRTDTPMPLPVDQLHAREYDKAKLAAWLKTQGFRSIATRLGLDSEAAPPAATPVEAAPRRAQAALPLADAAQAGGRRRRASVPMRRSPPRPRCAISWRRSRPAASSPSTPRPTGWMRCARRWSGCRLRSRRDAPPICRCGTRGWRSRCRSPLRSPRSGRC